MLEDERLLAILSSGGGPREWVERMIAEANERGGLDNITAIVVRTDAPAAERTARTHELEGRPHSMARNSS